MVELDLKCYRYFLELFDSLTFKPNSEVEIYLPKLEKVVIHVGEKTAFPVEPFMELMKSWSLVMPLATTLREVSFFIAENLSTTFCSVKALLRSECEGVVVNVTVMGDAHWIKTNYMDP